MKKNRRMVSRQDAAEYLGCSLQTITNYVESGMLKGHHINGKLFVDSTTLHEIADTAKDIENAKRMFSELLMENDRVNRKLADEVCRTVEDIHLFKHSAASKITRDLIKSVIMSYGGELPDVAKDVLIDVVNYGNVVNTANKFSMETSSVIRIADLACRRIACARYDKKVKENESLRKRIAELELENRNLRNGVLCVKDLPDAELMKTRICECDLSVRTINCLTSMGINTVGDLTAVRLDEIARYRNVGRKTISEIKDFSMANGLGLK